MNRGARRRWIILGIEYILILFLNKSSGQPITPAIWPQKVEAVAVLSDYQFEVQSQKSGTLRVHQIFYIFNEKGKSYGLLRIPESDYLKSKITYGRLCDADGKEVRKLKSSDIIETNLSPEGIFYHDFKQKLAEMSWSKYPYSVEYKYEISFLTLYFWPDWYPQLKIPVLKANYTIILNQNVPFNYFPIGIDLTPTIKRQQNVETYAWTMENIEPLLEEDWMPPENRIQKAILFSPQRFEYGGYYGSFNSWQDFGLWYHQLINDRFTITPEIKNTLQEYLKSTSDKKERLNILYQFLQNYTRYVAILLGIGNIQPHPASMVFHNRYGDCKDLSTLMIAMCREAGIEAYPVLIRTRDEGIIEEKFPNNFFNHFIVLAIIDADSIWIESTADNIPMGELPPGIENCNALAITPAGGILVKTPASTSHHNVTCSKISGQLLHDGSYLFEGSISYSGNDADIIRNKLIDQTAQERKEWLSFQLLSRYFPQIKLDSCKFDRLSQEVDKPFTCTFKAKCYQFGVNSGNRLFVNPAVFHREIPSDIPKETARKFPIHYHYPFTTIDTVFISLPSGYVVEGIPERQDLHTVFGRYLSSFSVEDNKLCFVRMMRIDQQLIPAEQYDQYLSFIKSAVKSDQSKLVLRNK